MSEHQSYIRIMSDVIDSGIWAKLSSAAKTLYPVLLKFSDYNFKPVWPSTETLLGLTGFRTKKSIVLAKRDLEKHGLLHSVSGTGRTSTRFYFRFDYPGSKIAPLGDTPIPRRDVNPSLPGEPNSAVRRDTEGSPNHINITIHNNQKNESKKKNSQENPKPMDFAQEIPQQTYSGQSMGIETLIADFGADVFHYAYTEAEKRGLQNNFPYLKSICRNRVVELQKMLKNGQNSPDLRTFSNGSAASWKGFLDWAESRLTPSSSRELQKLSVHLDGTVLCVDSGVTPLQKNLIENYFRSQGDDVTLVFASPKVENRIF